MKINFIYKKKIKFSGEAKIRLKKVISHISENENKVFGIINIVFCSDEFIKEYNREFLDHDFETDIITFYDTDADGNAEGELLISADTVSYNSKRFKTDIEDEYSRVIIHGILHLCGYKDKAKHEKIKMKKMEDFYLNYINS